MAKKILFSFFSIILLYLSYDLIKIILVFGPFNVIVTIIISWGVNVLITGVFALPGFVFPTNRILISSYYRIRNAENLLRVYKTLRVNLFRNLLLIFFWGKKKNKDKYFDGTKGGIDNLIYQSKQSEFGHLGAFVSILIVSIILLFETNIQIVFIIMLINIFTSIIKDRLFQAPEPFPGTN